MQLSSIDARMAISIGTVDFIESSFGVGDAYKISGKALDKKGRRKIRFVSDILPNSNAVDLLIHNTDFISARWTSKQCKIVLLALQNKDQKAIASKLHISQQAVSKQIDVAGWMIVSDNVDYFKYVVLNASIPVKATK
jgi:DNA-binding NarL/FixJ family response regulator